MVALSTEMLDTCGGAPVHAGNFMRAFRQLPAVLALRLRDNPGATPAELESFVRFVLQQVNGEIHVRSRGPVRSSTRC
jgi:hypothetical protein